MRYLIDKKEMEELFYKRFGQKSFKKEFFFSPGRVNLIGEHIDYSGGFVFPMAISLGISACVSFNDSDIIRIFSDNAADEVLIDIKKEIARGTPVWGDYPKGVIKLIIEEGYSFKGFDMVIKSDLPQGAGLSSSASLEVLTAYIIFSSVLEETKIDMLQIARLCQKAENIFVGVKCGIMDQFAVAAGRKGFAVKLDCASMAYEYVPADMGEYSLIIMNTNKKRELSDSKYNQRRDECDLALLELSRKYGEKALTGYTLVQVEDTVKDPVIKKRCRHAITENQRVLKAVESLKCGDIMNFSNLMIQSNISLKYDYEVTGFELDTIVDSALKQKGCIGARMTGAGFGGCAIALVAKALSAEFISEVDRQYTEKTGIQAGFYTIISDDGTRKVY